MTCSAYLCDRQAWARGLCSRHYGQAYRRGRHLEHGASRGVWVNPLVCVCADPVTDRLGECQTCHRKPLNLLRRPS